MLSFLQIYLSKKDLKNNCIFKSKKLLKYFNITTIANSQLQKNMITKIAIYFEKLIIIKYRGIPIVMLKGKVTPNAIGIYNPGSALGAAKRMAAGTAM